ncbi:MAG: hypothetical protein U1E73_08925 [Planctomycetota bacterium]
MNENAAVLLCCSLVFGAPAVAQGTPSLVADLNTTPLTSYGFGYVKCAAQSTTFTCFLTDDGGALTQLWRTDGTSAGTALLATIHAWTAEPLEMVARNGLVFFTAPSTNAGVELWVSDGTTAGTTIRDCNPGAPSSSPRHLVVDLTTTGTRIWFSATDAVAGRELWTSDGGAYPATTRRVYDLYPGIASSMLTSDEIQPNSNGVYFAATNGSTGRELWNYVSGAPTLVANIMTGSGSSNPANLVGTSTDLLFTATGPNGTELYRWNTSTLTLLDVRPGTASSSPSDLVLHYPPTLGGRCCFFAADGGNGIGRELWRYDLVTGALNSYDLVPGSAGADPVLTKLGGQVLAIAGPSTARQLFGVPVGSTTATLLPAGNGSVDAVFAAFTTPDVALVYMAGPLFGQHRVYHTDGTVAGTVADADVLGPPFATLPGGATVLTRDFWSATRPVRVVDDQPTSTPALDLVPQIGATAGSSPGAMTDIGGGVVVFPATTANGAEMWRSDGTAAGTFAIGPAGSTLGPKFLGKHYYFASDGTANLYATDGTVAGTSLVATGMPYPGPAPRFTVLGSRLLAQYGATLLVTQGTAATTTVLQQSPAHPELAYRDQPPVVLGGHAYFLAADATHGVELWRTDGTVAGTQRFFDTNPGSADGCSYKKHLHLLTSLGVLLFVADDGVHGAELWRTEGSSAGTYLVKDTVPGSVGGMADDECDVVGDDQVPALLRANTPANGIEPWLTNGTAAGTFLLVDATPGPNSSSTEFLGRLGGTLVLAAGRDLFETQGTVASTGNLTNSTTNLAFNPDAVLVPGALVVKASNGLWRTDGTPAGSYLLANSYVYTRFGIPQGTKALVGMQTVSGPGMAVGEELWSTDGSVGGTRVHADIHPGTADSFPGGFVLSGGRIFFFADDGVHGYELFAMTSMAGAIPYGSPCAGSAGLPGIAATTPVLGGSFVVSLDHALANTLAVLVLGLDSAELPLGGGCSLRVSTAAPFVNIFTLTSPNGTASVPTAVPNSTSFGGLVMNGQFAVFDPSGAYQNLLAFTGAVSGILGP